MAEVTVTLNGRSYRLECDDGEEKHLLSLSEIVGIRLIAHQKNFGQVGDDRLLLMTALTIADELAETQRKLAEIEQDRESTDERIRSAEARLAEQIAAAADRMEVLSAAINSDGAGGKES